MTQWLSQREAALLGCALILDEIWYVAVRRIAALLLLEVALDGNYARGRTGP